jgi:hypothetical protein
MRPSFQGQKWRSWSSGRVTTYEWPITRIELARLGEQEPLKPPRLDAFFPSKRVVNTKPEFSPQISDRSRFFKMADAARAQITQGALKYA